MNTTRNRRVTCGHEQGSILVALPGTFRQLLSEASRHLPCDLKELDDPESRGDRRAGFSPEPIPRRAGEGVLMLHTSELAPKGLDKSAQGIALGYEDHYTASPERA